MSATLPRTRSFRRSRPMRLWWMATGIALLVNLAVVVVLGQLSRVTVEETLPPPAVRRIERFRVPPPSSVAPAPAASAAIAAMPLPDISLPALPAPSGVVVPELRSLAIPVDLPLTMPAFAAVDGLPPDGSVDTPAERSGDLDLDRFYPRSARQRGITGSTRMRLAITATGEVSAVTVLESTPEGVFEHAAERLGASLRFRPAVRAGATVASELVTTVVWAIR